MVFEITTLVFMVAILFSVFFIRAGCVRMMEHFERLVKIHETRLNHLEMHINALREAKSGGPYHRKKKYRPVVNDDAKIAKKELGIVT